MVATEAWNAAAVRTVYMIDVHVLNDLRHLQCEANNGALQSMAMICLMLFRAIAAVMVVFNSLTRYGKRMERGRARGDVATQVLRFGRSGLFPG